MPSRPRPEGYLPEIDGLRAIAVVAVMAYHADPRWLPGGYAGVDVFFVISGFLITRVLLADIESGRPLTHFWDRRVRRILPPLLAVISVALAGGWLLFSPPELAGVAASAFAALFSAANVYFWLTSGGYFGLAAPMQPLLHLWSLGVEEQFYLLYPLVLFLVIKHARRYLSVAIWVAAAASFAFACYSALYHPVAGFFLPMSRAWELLVGCGLALLPRTAQRPSRFVSDAVCLLASGVLIATFALAHDGTPWPGLATLPLVASSAALVHFAPHSSRVRQLLSARLLVGMGLISYGTYLWHHLLLSGARIVLPDQLGAACLLVLLLVSTGLGAVSYHAIEKPMRDRRRWPKLQFYGFLAASLGALAAAAFYMWRSDGAPDRLSPRMQAISAMTSQYPAAIDPCFYPPDSARPFESSCVRGSIGPARMAILGDSHAMAIAPGFDPLLEEAESRSRLLVAAGCPPVTDRRVMSRLQPHCAAFSEKVYRWVASQRDIRVVALAARWPFSFEHTFYDNGEGGVEIGPDDGLDPDASRERRFEISLKRNVARLLASGKTVILIYPVPEPGWDVPKYLVHQYLLRGTASMPSIEESRWRRRAAPAVAMLDRIGFHPRLIRIQPAEATCGNRLPGRCTLGTATWPYYFDDDHPNRAGAEVMIDQQLRQTGYDSVVLEALRDRPSISN